LPEILPLFRGLWIFVPSNPQLKLRAIFIRRSATLRHCVKTSARFAPLRDISTRRQPDDFAKRRPRLEFHEAFQFFTRGLRRGRRLTNSLSDVLCPT
jgi:hypothetical protein